MQVLLKIVSLNPWGNNFLGIGTYQLYSYHLEYPIWLDV